MMNTKSIGDIGEKLAVKLLKSKKFKILSRNLHKGRNELDIIAQNRDHIVFVEVKTRTVDDPSKISFEVSAAAAVDVEKKRRTVTAAKAYLAENPNSRQQRFDVVEVYLLRENMKLIEINHIENAF